jgi:sulfatase modifying factor 1
MRRLDRALWALFSLLAAASCKKSSEAPAPTASAAPSASVAAPANPVVTIPAGSFRAGMVCGGMPRVTTEELGGDEIALGEFSIDVFPYPNDPSRPARVGVSRDEASALCVQGGKRLCSELEWERACKGPSGTMFEYGAGFSPLNCKKEGDLLLDKRPRCVSGFGVKDMHGLVFEWTSSAWGRGTTGDLGTVRGGEGPAGLLQARCANGQSRPPSTQASDVGFRCCSGPVNSSEVKLSLDVKPPIAQDPSVDAVLGAAMMAKMPVDHRTQKDADTSFDALWRWHPRPNEEMLVARWISKPKDKTKTTSREVVVFHVCAGVPSLITRMRGPSAALGAPVADTDPQKITLPVATDPDKGDVKIHYVYGAAQLEQPPWVKVRSSIAADAPPASSAHVVIPPPKKK